MSSIAVHLVGDSTMSEKSADARPETGWGMPFADWVDDAVTVENHARNGRSSRTFLEEGRWEPVIDALSEGDYVFVQFGHNDEDPEKDRYTPPAGYVANLERYVSETHEAGGRPVLLTPITRRRFDGEGRVPETHRGYSALARGVAAHREVPAIDMDARSRALLDELGVEASKRLFLHLEPGEHENYPDGVTDDTHFSVEGAERMAELVVAGLVDLDLGLADHVEPRGR